MCPRKIRVDSASMEVIEPFQLMDHMRSFPEQGIS